jgi:hypothetical protein
MDDQTNRRAVSSPIPSWLRLGAAGHWLTCTDWAYRTELDTCVHVVLVSRLRRQGSFNGGDYEHAGLAASRTSGEPVE